ncbi:DNA-methyltransferase [Streptomyces sp. NPDC088736]|uniref:DNA-methyltransferase n=1 Tax=Streptomyces sp. NPDC088736 TaxID=3365881 RepID=UPI003827CB3E
MEAYYEDDTVQLYLGDMREVLPALGITADLIVADPPYGETSHGWDRWPDGWVSVAAAHSNAMWCFGSQRMFFDHLAEFQSAGWKLSQDVIGHDEDGQPVIGDVNVVWEKHNGTGFATDRFKRVHEHVLHWYRGPWNGVHQDVPRVPSPGLRQGSARTARKVPRGHTGAISGNVYVDDGTRLMKSVIKVPSVRRGIHRTQKPEPLLLPLIQYGCPPGGLVVDPFGGSCSTLLTARQLGLRAVAIEGHEPHAEAAARSLSEPYSVALFGGGAA